MRSRDLGEGRETVDREGGRAAQARGAGGAAISGCWRWYAQPVRSSREGAKVGRIQADRSKTAVERPTAVRRIDPTGNVTTVAGDGDAGYADGQPGLGEVNGPGGVAFDASGNVFITDTLNNCIRKLVP